MYTPSDKTKRRFLDFLFSRFFFSSYLLYSVLYLLDVLLLQCATIEIYKICGSKDAADLSSSIPPFSRSISDSRFRFH